MTDLSKSGFESRVDRMWYSDSRWTKSLAPLSWVYGRLAEKRRHSYLLGKKTVWNAPVPVCVVGNITVGGTGKTPLVALLAHWLSSKGKKVGIVSRGYGGRSTYPLVVSPETSVYESGDEALLLARRTRCPIVVDPDRVEAVRTLLDRYDVDLVLADDGLQHYALGRQIEIVVIDGSRGIGNGMLLPAGPLREPVDRLDTVDWIVANGRHCGLVDHEWVMRYQIAAIVNVATEVRMEISDFQREHGKEINAVAAIGNPRRFRNSLVQCGFATHLSAFRDHHMFVEADFKIGR